VPHFVREAGWRLVEAGEAAGVFSFVVLKEASPPDGDATARD
jgi:hypothetical protein